MTTTDVAAAPIGQASAQPPAQPFPAGFVWGVATAAYQIEGAAAEDGRRASIWDTFSHTPGKIQDGTNGDVAADHYHRFGDDIALMADLGVAAYRFSISWPRIVPDGTGGVNRDGLDFYARLIDGLLGRGIRPAMTLYHWDLPQALQDAGGWPSRDTAYRFAELAAFVGDELGDRVEVITTLNEPWCSAFLGYASGVHAPGATNDRAALAAAHHLNLAHGLAISALRSVVPDTVKLSVTLNLATVRGARREDSEAVRHVDAMANRIFLDPMFRGSYPADLIEDTASVSDWSFVLDRDLNIIKAPVDVLGINYYSPTLVTTANDDLLAQVSARWVNDPQGADGPSQYPGTRLAVALPQEGPYTAMNWRIDPDSFTELLQRVARDYPSLPIMITENGAAFDDPAQSADPGEPVADPARIAYLRDHLLAVHRAIEAGVDVRGYYVWSLLDNFEWAWGLSKRFGIVHVDFATQQRRLKQSALWYRDVISRNGLD